MKRTWVHSFFEALKRAGDPYDAGGAGGDPGPHTIEEALLITQARARLMTRKVEFKIYPGSDKLPADEKTGLWYWLDDWDTTLVPERSIVAISKPKPFSDWKRTPYDPVTDPRLKFPYDPKHDKFWSEREGVEHRDMRRRLGEVRLRPEKFGLHKLETTGAVCHCSYCHRHGFAPIRYLTDTGMSLGRDCGVLWAARNSFGMKHGYEDL